MKATWKNTFNAGISRWALEKAVLTAHAAGYEYIAWNDGVYALADTKHGPDIDTTKRVCLVENMDRGAERMCHRGACGKPGATWFNKSTLRYYCAECASRINAQPDQAGLCVETEIAEVEVPVQRSQVPRTSSRATACELGCVCCRGGDGPCCPNKCCKK